MNKFKRVKALIFDITRFAIHDGPGIRTTIFFKGCPLNCWWCHNPEGISNKIETISKEVELDDAVIKTTEKVGRWITLDEMMTEVEKERIFMEQSGGGVTFSGGEPLFYHSFLISALERCRSAGFHTCIDTSGYASTQVIKEIGKKADLILFDLKLMNEEEHKKYTGVSNKVILNNLDVLYSMQVELVIRIPLIPGINADTDHMLPILNHLRSMKKIEKIDLLPYHYLAGNKYRQLNKPDRMNGTSRLNDDQRSEIQKIFTDAGFQVSIGG